MLILTYLSETKIKQRAFLGLVPQFWFLPCLIALSVIPSNTSKWGSYALVTVLLSYPSRKWCPKTSRSARPNNKQRIQCKWASVVAIPTP